MSQSQCLTSCWFCTVNLYVFVYTCAPPPPVWIQCCIDNKGAQMVTSLVSISLFQNGLDTGRLPFYGNSQMDHNDTFCHAHNPLNVILLAMYSYGVVLCNCILAGWVSVGSRTFVVWGWKPVKFTLEHFFVFSSERVDSKVQIFLAVFYFPLV